jgi:hypothetical protein
VPFTIHDLRDLIQLLEQHPEWRAEVRRLVLTEELLALPELVRGLAEGQRQMQEDLRTLAAAQARTEERLEALAAAQARTEERLETLVAAQARTNERLEALAAAQGRTEDRQSRIEEVVGNHTASLRRLENDVGRLKGSDLERSYRERPIAYFSGVIRRARALTPDQLQGLLDQAVAGGRLTEDEADDVMLADAVIRGRRREDGADVYLVVEASWGIAPHDVQRASRRAALLARADVQAVPVVAGAELLPEARRLARSTDVIIVTNGTRLGAPGAGGAA